MPNNYLFCRSADRRLGTSSSFVVSLPQTYRSITSISLVSAELAFSMYNIAEPYTTGIRFTHNASTYDMQLAPGFFTIDDLRATMLALLQSAFPSAGVSAINYSTATAKLSIVYTSGLTFAVQSTSTGSLGRVVGTDPLGTATLATAGALTFPNVAQLFPTSSLFIRIAELPSLTASTNQQHAFTRIQLSSAPGSIVMANNASGVVNTNIYTTAIPSLSSLTVSLFSADGYPVDLHGCDWCFTLALNCAA